MKVVKRNKPFKFVPPSKKQLKVQTWWIADKIKEHDGIIADGAITFLLQEPTVLPAMIKF